MRTLEDVLASKRAAAREKDKATIPVLEQEMNKGRFTTENTETTEGELSGIGWLNEMRTWLFRKYISAGTMQREQPRMNTDKHG